MWRALGAFHRSSKPWLFKVLHNVKFKKICCMLATQALQKVRALVGVFNTYGIITKLSAR